MRDILYPDDPEKPRDAYVASRKSMEKPLPKRFYAHAGVEPGENGYRIVLDGKRALTPARNELALATPEAAAEVAAEWQAVVEAIDPARMPATRIANVGIDRVGAVREAVIDDIAKYARSDLVCYRAADPAGLVEREAALWDPVLAHVRQAHGATFVLSQGIGYADQPETSVARVREAVARIADPVALAAFHTMTTIAGSVLIPLCVADGALTGEAAFLATAVEEDWSVSQWGEDDEARARRDRRRHDFLVAERLFKALTGAAGQSSSLPSPG